MTDLNQTQGQSPQIEPTATSERYPLGAFRFEDWWQRDEVRQNDSYYDIAKRAFEAGYVSAVRHHDAAMLRQAEWDSPEDAVYNTLDRSDQFGVVHPLPAPGLLDLDALEQEFKGWDSNPASTAGEKQIPSLIRRLREVEARANPLTDYLKRLESDLQVTEARMTQLERVREAAQRVFDAPGIGPRHHSKLEALGAALAAGDSA